MDELYDKIIFYIADIENFERWDSQFQSLKRLWENFYDKEVFLALIIVNSIACYQLSMKWEEYWEAFSRYFQGKELKMENVIDEMISFLSLFNKRLVEGKKKRIKKLEQFLVEFENKSQFYYENMLELRDDLAKILWISNAQLKKNEGTKTLNFAVKMFAYGARNLDWYGGFRQFPVEIWIPIDSRLEQIYQKYGWNYSDINWFYRDLAMKLGIAPLHLDGILWVNFTSLLN